MRARVERFREEIEILEEEFSRTHRAFSKQAQVWEELSIKKQGLGFSCYANRQAAISDRLALDCQEEWRTLQKKYGKFVRYCGLTICEILTPNSVRFGLRYLG